MKLKLPMNKTPLVLFLLFFINQAIAQQLTVNLDEIVNKKFNIQKDTSFYYISTIELSFIIEKTGKLADYVGRFCTDGSDYFPITYSFNPKNQVSLVDSENVSIKSDSISLQNNTEKPKIVWRFDIKDTMSFKFNLSNKKYKKFYNLNIHFKPALSYKTIFNDDSTIISFVFTNNSTDTIKNIEFNKLDSFDIIKKFDLMDKNISDTLRIESPKRKSAKKQIKDTLVVSCKFNGKSETKKVGFIYNEKINEAPKFTQEQVKYIIAGASILFIVIIFVIFRIRRKIHNDKIRSKIIKKLKNI